MIHLRAGCWWPATRTHSGDAKELCEYTSEGMVLMFSHSKSEWENLIPIMLNSPDAIIMPQYHGIALYMESVIRQHGDTLESVPAIASPPLDVFSAFMGRGTGKAGTRP